ncbi:hypothetical protein Y032_0057g2789 [Ancylostoma ceylanicum]|uniref:Uncharacterized protein n=1 Tax=Ancylostoma ceylanicum TaxID=53326 RepID=A0A016U5D4_9BILA|nr:hypothetical protein Y032_0057g2789 [Ancylostoma ceylanicum]
MYKVSKDCTYGEAYVYVYVMQMETYSQLQMSVDNSWDRGAVLLRVSALHATLNLCSRQRETRAAPPTLVYGHLELTIGTPNLS